MSVALAADQTTLQPTGDLAPAFGRAPLAAKVLIVDDRHADRLLLRTILESRGHEVVESADGEEAMGLLHSVRPDLVITDVMMPRMDGFELAARLRGAPEFSSIPLVVYSGTYTNDEERSFACASGATLYLQKPVAPGEFLAKVESLLEGKGIRARQAPPADFTEQHTSILSSKLVEKMQELERVNQQLRDAMLATVQAMDRMVEYRDPYTAGHQRRVGLLASQIGRELGLGEHQVEGLLVGGYLHDVGKMFAPAEILSRPGGLNDLETGIVRAHSIVGHDILQGVSFPWPVAQMALQHHERMDGSGYPHGLKGEAILLEARIIAVADVVEAMATHRPYRPALGLEAALAEIERGRGTIYDADAVQACVRLFREKRHEL